MDTFVNYNENELLNINGKTPRRHETNKLYFVSVKFNRHEITMSTYSKYFKMLPLNLDT